MADPPKPKKPTYYFTDSLGFRISEFYVLFVADMAEKSQRDNAAYEAVKRHTRWKVQAHMQYRENCKQYVLVRRRWKYQLIQNVQNMNEITWSTTMAMKKVMRIANFRQDAILFDYRLLVKHELAQARHYSQDSDTTDEDDEE